MDQLQGNAQQDPGSVSEDDFDYQELDDIDLSQDLEDIASIDSSELQATIGQNQQDKLEFNFALQESEKVEDVRSSSLASESDILAWLDKKSGFSETTLSKRESNNSQQGIGGTKRRGSQCESFKLEGAITPRLRRRQRKVLTANTLYSLQSLFGKYDLQRQGLNGLKVKRKLTFRCIAKEVCLCAQQIKNLYQEYRQDPLFTIRFKQLPSEVVLLKQNQDLMQARLCELDRIIKENCVLTQQQIADELNKVEGLQSRDQHGHLVPITKKVVQILLKLGKYSKKKVQLVPKNRNSQQTIENRYEYCRRYLEIMKEDNAEIYFLDECRFNLFTARDRGWAKVGNPASKVVANSKGRDVTLLAMIGIDGLANFELSDGYNAAAFTIALDRIAREMVQKGGDKKRYIVMDNCPIHNKENLHHIEKGYNIKVVFLPPYSPMLNPIENWFNELKQVIRQKTYKTRLELKQTLEAVLERYRDKSFANYYSHINQYLDLGIKRELER